MAYAIVDFQPLARVRRITGLEVVILVGPIMVAHDEDGLIHWEQKFPMTKSGTKRAAEDIINQNYAAVREIVFAEQGGRCIRCDKKRPLECNHKLHRGAHGRNDRRENLEGICTPCHEEEHRGFSKRVRQIGELA